MGSIVIAAAPYAPPRTSDGRPDLQGIWTNNTITPLERPKDLASTPFFSSDAEALAWQTHTLAHLGDSQPLEQQTTGEPPDVWSEIGPVVPSRRTSLLIDPPDGKVPLNETTRQRNESRRGDATTARAVENPEELTPPERCLVWGPGAPMLPRPFNAGLQIVQTPGHVLIALEMIHEARIVPLDGRPHLPPDMRRWQGDSRGHWDGDTLVVETTNFTAKTRIFGSTANMHVMERFTRTADDTLLYQFTVENADLFARPWTAEIPLRRATALIYEYACHEANYSMEGMLRAGRAQR